MFQTCSVLAGGRKTRCAPPSAVPAGIPHARAVVSRRLDPSHSGLRSGAVSGRRGDDRQTPVPFGGSVRPRSVAFQPPRDLPTHPPGLESREVPGGGDMLELEGRRPDRLLLLYRATPLDAAGSLPSGAGSPGSPRLSSSLPGDGPSSKLATIVASPRVTGAHCSPWSPQKRSGVTMWGTWTIGGDGIPSRLANTSAVQRYWRPTDHAAQTSQSGARSLAQAVRTWSMFGLFVEKNGRSHPLSLTRSWYRRKRRGRNRRSLPYFQAKTRENRH